MNSKRKKVEVSSLKPGDPVFSDGRIIYIKNIYESGFNVGPIVEKYYGQSVVFEYTDLKENCNKNYTKPESETIQVDYSCKTPSIWPLSSLIEVPN